VDPVVEDNTAVRAARDGDRDAFAVLVARYQEVAFRTAYLVVRDAAEAEDVTQEAFVRAYQNLSRYDTSHPFRPWLLRIVTNLALNQVRSRARRQGLLARFGRLRTDDQPAPEGDLLVDEERALLWQAVNELPENDRLVLYLRYFLELPEREIAVALGTAPGTVKSRLHRSSARLRDIIDRRYPALRPQPSPAGGTHA
jgi:RNA polymerase sigma-70 factor (ECF subfamily)